MQNIFHINYNLKKQQPESLEDIVENAKKNGIEYISIIDTDKLQFIESYMQYGEQYGIKVIPGVMVNVCNYGKMVLTAMNENGLKDIFRVIHETKPKTDGSILISKEIVNLYIKENKNVIVSIPFDVGVTGHILLAGANAEKKLEQMKGYADRLEPVYVEYRKQEQIYASLTEQVSKLKEEKIIQKKYSSDAYGRKIHAAESLLKRTDPDSKDYIKAQERLLYLENVRDGSKSMLKEIEGKIKPLKEEQSLVRKHIQNLQASRDKYLELKTAILHYQMPDVEKLYLELKKCLNEMKEQFPYFYIEVYEGLEGLSDILQKLTGETGIQAIMSGEYHEELSDKKMEHCSVFMAAIDNVKILRSCHVPLPEQKTGTDEEKKFLYLLTHEISQKWKNSQIWDDAHKERYMEEINAIKTQKAASLLYVMYDLTKALGWLSCVPEDMLYNMKEDYSKIGTLVRKYKWKKYRPAGYLNLQYTCYLVCYLLGMTEIDPVLEGIPVYKKRIIPNRLIVERSLQPFIGSYFRWKYGKYAVYTIGKNNKEVNLREIALYTGKENEYVPAYCDIWTGDWTVTQKESIFLNAEHYLDIEFAEDPVLELIKETNERIFQYYGKHILVSDISLNEEVFSHVFQKEKMSGITDYFKNSGDICWKHASDINELHRILSEKEDVGNRSDYDSKVLALQLYRIAWLKYHYPFAFYCSLFNQRAGQLRQNEMESDVYGDIFDECSELGIRILPPDINKSSYNFKIEREAIRFGYCGICGMAQRKKQAENVIRNKNGIYESVKDFIVKNINNNGKTRFPDMDLLTLLVYAGMFDRLMKSRENLVSFFQKCNEMNLPEEVSLSEGIIMKLPLEDEHPSLDFNMSKEIQVLGRVVSEDPLARYKDDSVYGCIKISDLKEGESGLILGFVSSVKIKEKNDKCKMTLSIHSRGGRFTGNIQGYLALKYRFHKEYMECKVLQLNVEKRDGVFLINSFSYADISPKEYFLTLKNAQEVQKFELIRNQFQEEPKIIAANILCRNNGKIVSGVKMLSRAEINKLKEEFTFA